MIKNLIFALLLLPVLSYSQGNAEQYFIYTDTCTISDSGLMWSFSDTTIVVAKLNSGYNTLRVLSAYECFNDANLTVNCYYTTLGTYKTYYNKTNNRFIRVTNSINRRGMFYPVLMQIPKG